MQQLGVSLLMTIGGLAGAAVIFLTTRALENRRETVLLFRRVERLAFSSSTGAGPADLDRLPQPVRRYLRWALPEDAGPVRLARIRQRAMFRTGPDVEWKPLRARQLVSVMEPAFVWSAWMRRTPMTGMRARDQYVDGRGRMWVALQGAWTVADVTGPEMDVSCLLRWLAEAVFYPTALLPGGPVSWESVDERSARARVRSGGREVSAVFTFGEEGGVEEIRTSERYRCTGKGPVREPWTVRCRGYRALQPGGPKVPTECDVVWGEDGAEFHYGRFRVVGAEHEP